MSKSYSATKHLYTLNDQKISSDQEVSGSQSLDQQVGVDYQQLQRDNKKLSKKNQELHRKLSELQLKNQQLLQLSQLSQRRNIKHEEKQRDLIKKLSYYQVSNKQLSHQIKKIHQDMLTFQQNKKISDGHTHQIKQLIKKTQNDKDKFIIFLKNIMEMLKRCDRPQQYQQEKQKIFQFIARNINHTQSSQKITFDFDFKFQLSRVDTLKEKIRGLERELEEYQQIAQKQKNQRKKIANVMNQKIYKLRQLHDDLKNKVQSQQQQHKRKIKNIVHQKNEVIQVLKSKLKQSRTRKSSMQMKRSKQQKSFIGDGQYSHLELNELNDAIQTLEMQIIKQFQE